MRVQTAEPGALDDVLPEVLPILEAELWGDVADEKEAGAFSGSCREAKKLRAADTFQLLAQGTTFRSHIGPLLRPVRFRLHALTPTYGHCLVLPSSDCVWYQRSANAAPRWRQTSRVLVPQCRSHLQVVIIEKL